MTQKTFLGAIVLAVLLVAVSSVGIYFNTQPQNGAEEVEVGGAQPVRIQYDRFDFREGFYAGINRAFEITRTGALTSSATTTFSGHLKGAKFVSTGSKTTLTAGATTTFTGLQACSTNYFEWFPTVANASATLPSQASILSTGNCLSTTGDNRTVFFRSGSNAASTTIFAAGASTTIKYASSTGSTILPGGNVARIDILVSSSSDPTSGITYLIGRFE